MADTPEKQAVTAASYEGAMAARRGETENHCPYGDIGGIIAEQRKAWLAGLKGA